MKKTIGHLLFLILSFILISAFAFAICYDTDGEDYYTIGYASENQTTKLYDVCYDYNTVTERICKGSNLSSVNYYCTDSRCIDGACKKIEKKSYSCEDKDGLNYNVASFIMDENDVQINDSCFNSNIVSELYCKKNEITR